MFEQLHRARPGFRQQGLESIEQLQLAQDLQKVGQLDGLASLESLQGSLANACLFSQVGLGALFYTTAGYPESDFREDRCVIGNKLKFHSRQL